MSVTNETADAPPPAEASAAPPADPLAAPVDPLAAPPLDPPPPVTVLPPVPVKVESADEAPHPFTVLAQAGLLLAFEGLSFGLFLGLLLIKGTLDDFFAANLLATRARLFGLVMEVSGAAVALGVAAFVGWRRRRDPGTPAALLHAARRLAPLGVLGFLPLLFRWKMWQGRDLTFLALVGAAVLVLGVGLRVAVEAGPFRWEARLWERAAAALGRVAARWPRLSPRLPLLLVCAGALGYALYFSYHTCAWHWSVRSGYDLALENNIIWNLLHGGQWMKSSPLVGPVGTHFGYHATLFAYVIVPVYAFAQRPETLLVLQSTLLGAAAIPLFLIARRYLAPALACLVALAYLFYPGLHGANLYEFHYLPLGTFFLWLTLYALEARRNVLAVVAVVLTLSVREDVALSLSIWGAYLLLAGRRPRAGLAIIVTALTYFVLMKMVIMPRFIGGETFTDIFRRLLPPGERTFGSVLKTVIANPGYTLGTLLEPAKLVYALQIMLPVAFIPLRRPLGVLFIVPGFFFTLLSTDYWPTISITYQYTAHWATFLFVGVVFALAKLARAHRRAAVGAMVLGLLACSYQYGSILQTNKSYGGPIPYKFKITDEDRQRRHSLDEVLKHLPPDAKVSCSGFTTPQVSSRADAYSMTLGVYDAQYLLFPSEAGDFIGDERQTVTNLLTAGTFGVVIVKPPFALARKGHATEGNAALMARWR
jgi:uncharacterized membrane protein